MEIKFTPMDKEDFSRFISLSTVDYAADKVKNGTWPEDIAEQLAKASFDGLLPDGPATKDNYLKNIQAGDKKVGYIWYAVKDEFFQKYAFLFEIKIFAEHRGQGYGTQALQVLKKEAADLELEAIWLHVFAHNRKALKLYENTGFEISDYNLRLSLK